MSSGGFEKRSLKRPETPLRAVIETQSGVAGGFVENLTLDGLYVRLKKHNFTVSRERVSLDLFLAASNAPSVLKTEVRIVRVDETGISLQFRPMALSQHNRLKAIIAFVTPEGDGSEGI